MKKQTSNIILDAYEKEIEDSISIDAKFSTITEKEKEDFAVVAAKHKLFKASKRINIRIKNEDLIKVKAKAVRSNIPYQTLLSVLVHKYADGELTVSL